MKKFMRYWAAVLFAALMLGAFAACGENSKPADGEPSSNTTYDADGFETVDPEQNTDDSNEDSQGKESTTETSGDTTEEESNTEGSVDLPKIPI